MTNWKLTIRHFALMVWNDLILNRNKLGRRRNAFLVTQDVSLPSRHQRQSLPRLGVQLA